MHKLHISANQFERYSFPRNVLSIIAIIVSIFSLAISTWAFYNSQTISRTKLALDALSEMRSIQSEVGRSYARSQDLNTLSDSDMLLLNHYDLLLKTFVKYAGDNLLTKAKCNSSFPVNLRTRPYPRAQWIGGINPNEEVKILGKFNYDENTVWFFVATKDNKLGWAFKYFELIQSLSNQ